VETSEPVAMAATEVGTSSPFPPLSLLALALVQLSKSQRKSTDDDVRINLILNKATYPFQTNSPATSPPPAPSP